MAELNKFSLYNFGIQGATMSTKDKVDRWVEDMIDLHDYNEVKDFVQRNFGNVDGIQWFDYPELSKKVYVLNEPEKIEICTLKNDKQYYGKGWKYIQRDVL